MLNQFMNFIRTVPAVIRPALRTGNVSAPTVPGVEPRLAAPSEVVPVQPLDVADGLR